MVRGCMLASPAPSPHAQTNTHTRTHASLLPLLRTFFSLSRLAKYCHSPVRLGYDGAGGSTYDMGQMNYTPVAEPADGAGPALPIKAAATHPIGQPTTTDQTAPSFQNGANTSGVGTCFAPSQRCWVNACLESSIHVLPKPTVLGKHMS